MDDKESTPKRQKKNDPTHSPATTTPAEAAADPSTTPAEAAADPFRGMSFQQLAECALRYKESAEHYKERFKATRQDKSLDCLFTLQEGALKLRYSGSSHKKPPNADAEPGNMDFCLLGLTEKNRKSLEESNKCSALLDRFAKEGGGYREFPAHNEAEVARFVDLAVHDAVALAKLTHKNQFLDLDEITVGLERNLFSRKADILVLYLNRVPVLATEVKGPLLNSNLKDHKPVLGQCYDYARMVQAFGHGLPSVVLTTFAETVVCCTKEHSATSVGSPTGVVTPRRRDAKYTKSPPAAATPPLQMTNPVEHVFCPEQDRNIYLSSSFKSCHLVQVLHTALVQALFHSPRESKPRIVTLDIGVTYYFNDVLLMTNTHYEWGSLCVQLGEKIRVKRRARPRNPSDGTFFVIGCLGFGSTSNVYHALNCDGRQVALKVWVKRESEEIDHDDAERTQKRVEELEKEKEYLKQFYPFLKEEVEVVDLFQGLQCLVMPFFQPLKPEDRQRTLPKIKEVLEGSFVQHNKMYLDEDIRWHHIGKHVDDNGSEHIVLYDLAHLVDATGDFVTSHLRMLEGRLPEPPEDGKMFASEKVDA